MIFFPSLLASFSGGKPVKFSKDVDIPHKECHELLQKSWPQFVENPKVTQRLFIKYIIIYLNLLTICTHVCTCINKPREDHPQHKTFFYVEGACCPHLIFMIQEQMYVLTIHENCMLWIDLCVCLGWRRFSLCVFVIAWL